MGNGQYNIAVIMNQSLLQTYREPMVGNQRYVVGSNVARSSMHFIHLFSIREVR
jgi:hypothetical protein